MPRRKMSRGGRTLKARGRSFAARARFQPSGAHVCEVHLGGADDLHLSVGEVEQLIAALQAFRSEVMFEDGRTTDRPHPYIKPLGEF